MHPFARHVAPDVSGIRVTWPSRIASGLPSRIGSMSLRRFSPSPLSACARSASRPAIGVTSRYQFSRHCEPPVRGIAGLRDERDLLVGEVDKGVYHLGKIGHRDRLREDPAKDRVWACRADAPEQYRKTADPHAADLRRVVADERAAARGELDCLDCQCLYVRRVSELPRRRKHGPKVALVVIRERSDHAAVARDALRVPWHVTVRMEPTGIEPVTSCLLKGRGRGWLVVR